VLIEVEDTGTGMPPEVRRRSSSRSSRPRRSARAPASASPPSTASSSRPAASSIFDSEVGKGTTFRIFLPRHVAPGRAAGAAEATETSRDRRPHRHATILLVEDEEAVRAFAARALASRGYKVHEASSGLEALEVMEEAGGAIDLVVSDVVMPELDGPSLLKRTAQDAARPQDHLHLRLCRGRLQARTCRPARSSTSCRSRSR
jgi:two-component system, cell cycle sensor histidine kinase and response regulator CckA